MNTGSGYIKLHRKLLDNPIWTQLAPAVLKTAIYFLLRANRRPMQWWDGRQTVSIPAGSFITSYATVSKACAISLKQVRNAFEHLNGAQFATYKRAYRWTLVTVLNWRTYQGAQFDEGIGEGTDEGSLGALKGHGRGTKQECKNIRSNPSGSESDSPFSLNDPPFSTLEPERPSTNGNRGQADPVVVKVAASIHGRHPAVRRDCGVRAIQESLEAILKRQKIPKCDRESYLAKLDKVHSAWCLTEQWQKDGGEYAKGLENWLAPTKGRYEVEPPIASNPTQNGADDYPELRA